MKGHTDKTPLRYFASDDYDATVYTSGGELHTVDVVRYLDDSGHMEGWRKSFTGRSARRRALDYARGLITKKDPAQ